MDGAHIELSGSAANAKLGWLDKLKSLFGASYQIGSFNVEQAVANAAENFRGAIKGLLTPDNSCATADVVKVLNLQVINFASASARVPASAVEDLNQSAKVLNACARNGKTARLEVAGYSDNVGGRASQSATVEEACRSGARVSREDRCAGRFAGRARLRRCASGREQRHGERPLCQPPHRVRRAAIIAAFGER